MPFGATPSRWCVCHFTTSAECAKTNYTIWAANFAGVQSCQSGRCLGIGGIDPSVTTEAYARRQGVQQEIGCHHLN